MGKDEESAPPKKEKSFAGCTLSTWARLINLIVGGLMIAYSVFSFFEIPSGDNAIMLYSFKVYEM